MMRPTIALALALLASACAHAPALVGHGCTGTTGPIYAHEESDFPQCATIERVGL